MADHPNVEALREGYALFNKGDMAAASEGWSDDIVWHVAGNNPLSGDYRGKQQVLGFFGKMRELGLTSMNLEIHDIIANDEHGVALVEFNMERGERSFQGNSVHVWHLSGGKATEYWGIPTDQAKVDEIWS